MQHVVAKKIWRKIFFYLVIKSAGAVYICIYIACPNDIQIRTIDVK